MQDWHIWVIAAIVLLIAEVITPGFVIGCFGIGCLGAGGAALFTDDWKIQIVAFCATTLVVFFGIRPFVMKYLHRSSHAVKTNVDALAGRVARVCEAIDPKANTGRVMIGGEDWKAVSDDGSAIETGQQVKVVRVEGVKVFVKR